MSNVTLICLAPILFLALWGAGMFGGGDGLRAQDRALCFGGVAVLGFVAVLEYNNGAPWHILKGVAIGDLLLQFTARAVVYCTIRALPKWKRLPVLLSLFAPLFYPTIVQAVHRLQVSSPGLFFCTLAASDMTARYQSTNNTTAHGFTQLCSAQLTGAQFPAKPRVRFK